MRHTIWILEDSTDLHMRLSQPLVDAGWTMKVYDDGYVVFDMREDWPEIFIISVNLAGVNGLELCRWLKQDSETSSIPVILYSTSAELDFLASHGPADGVLSENFTTQELLEMIENLTAVPAHVD
jgi:DNA-binding response OmpR family regulator